MRKIKSVEESLPVMPLQNCYRQNEDFGVERYDNFLRISTEIILCKNNLSLKTLQ